MQLPLWLRRRDRRARGRRAQLRRDANREGSFRVRRRCVERPRPARSLYAPGLVPELERGARDAYNAWICREALCPVHATAFEVRDGNLAGHLDSFEWRVVVCQSDREKEIAGLRQRLPRHDGSLAAVASHRFRLDALAVTSHEIVARGQHGARLTP
jgi:hypothetical protein